MTRLDRSQMLTAVQPLPVRTRFDADPETTHSGGNAGDADVDQNKDPLAGRLVGNYKTNEIHFFAINLNWKFYLYKGVLHTLAIGKERR
jgi:hypothetical protein